MTRSRLVEKDNPDKFRTKFIVEINLDNQMTAQEVVSWFEEHERHLGSDVWLTDIYNIITRRKN